MYWCENNICKLDSAQYNPMGTHPINPYSYRVCGTVTGVTHWIYGENIDKNIAHTIVSWSYKNREYHCFIIIQEYRDIHRIPLFRWFHIIYLLSCQSNIHGIKHLPIYLRNYLRVYHLNIRQLLIFCIVNDTVLLRSIGSLGTIFCEFFIKIQNFSFTKIHMKNIACEMLGILSTGRWGNALSNRSWPHQQVVIRASETMLIVPYCHLWVLYIV